MNNRETISWALNEVAALETVLSSLKEGLILEGMRMDAKEEEEASK
jgi:hypothetical protein